MDPEEGVGGGGGGGGGGGVGDYGRDVCANVHAKLSSLPRGDNISVSKVS